MNELSPSGTHHAVGVGRSWEVAAVQYLWLLLVAAAMVLAVIGSEAPVKALPEPETTPSSTRLEALAIPTDTIDGPPSVSSS